VAAVAELGSFDFRERNREASPRLLRDGLAKSHRNAQAFIRYDRGSSQYGVFFSRFDSKNQMNRKRHDVARDFPSNAA
jgi:hypothetical protein